MPTVPDRPRPIDTPEAQALAEWLLTADVARFNNIGLARIAEIWFAAWDAAVRARAAAPAETTDGR